MKSNGNCFSENGGHYHMIALIIKDSGEKQLLNSSHKFPREPSLKHFASVIDIQALFKTFT